MNNKGQVYYAGVLGYQGREEGVTIFPPALIPNTNDIIQISSFRTHSLLLNKDGRVLSFGSNTDGELGLSSLDDKSIPTLIPDIDNIIQVSAGREFSLILNDKGYVYSFGRNQYGQLGQGHNRNLNKPTLIGNISDIIQISAGGHHSLLLDKNGYVYSFFGANGAGQLGLGDDIDKSIPTLIAKLENIIMVSCGNAHSLVLNKNGKVYSFGMGIQGQLGFFSIYEPIPSLIYSLIISLKYRVDLLP